MLKKLDVKYKPTPDSNPWLLNHRNRLTPRLLRSRTPSL